jgi:hypothetical protein
MRKGKDPDSETGSGSVSLTNGSGSGRPKNMRIRLRIPNTAAHCRSLFTLYSLSIRFWSSLPTVLKFLINKFVGDILFGGYISFRSIGYHRLKNIPHSHLVGVKRLMKRIEQGHLHPKLEISGLTCSGRE